MVAGLGALAFAAVSTNAGPTATAAPSPIVAGTVVNADAKPLAKLLVLFYLPIPSGAREAPKSVLVATARTDSAGHFEISTANTSLLATQARRNDGWLNFDLLVSSSTLTLYRAVARTYTGTGWAGPEDINKGSIDLGRLVLAPREPGVGPRGVSRTVELVQSSTACSESSVLLASAVLVTTIGEVHTHVGPATFNYGATADSNIDAVVKVGSAAWSESVGVVHIGNTRSSAAVLSSAAGSHRLVRTPFNYQKVQITNTCTGVRLTIKPVSWASVKLTTASTTDPSSRCTISPMNSAPRKVTFSAGTSFLRNANPAKKWPKAVDLSPLGGPSGLAGARSGYSSRVWTRWSFPSRGSLCGDTAAPSSSLRIFAGA